MRSIAATEEKATLREEGQPGDLSLRGIHLCRRDEKVKGKRRPHAGLRAPCFWLTQLHYKCEILDLFAATRIPCGLRLCRAWQLVACVTLDLLRGPSTSLGMTVCRRLAVKPGLADGSRSDEGRSLAGSYLCCC